MTTEKLPADLMADIDKMRDVYMLPSQREAYERILARSATHKSRALTAPAGVEVAFGKCRPDEMPPAEWMPPEPKMTDEQRQAEIRMLKDKLANADRALAKPGEDFEAKVEGVALAIFNSGAEDVPGQSWGTTPEPMKTPYRRMARAALDAAGADRNPE